MTSPGEPTHAELHELAAAAERLAAEVDTLRGRFDTAPDVVRRAGFRLTEIAGGLRDAGRELGATAADLQRTREALDPALCPAEWGVCPEHGNTLLSSGGRSRCQVDGREWDYDRGGLPCAEPVAVVAVDAEGHEQAFCRGHALAISGQPGWSVRAAASR